LGCDQVEQNRHDVAVVPAPDRGWFRVLVVGHHYAARINQQKLDALARRCAAVGLLVPSNWRDPEGPYVGQFLPLESGYDSFAMFPAPVVRAGHAASFLFEPATLGRALMTFKPDIIHVDQEVYSLAAAQLALAAKAARRKLVVLGVENLDRRIPLVERAARRTVLALADALVCANCARSVVGVTATTDVMPFASELCEFIKTLYPTAVCVLGGNHVTALPEKTLRESRFDLAVLGEGELTLLELLSAWRQGTNLNVIRGTAFLQDGAFFRNEPRDLIHNLDVLPFPAYDLINVEHHFGGIRDRTARAARCLYVLASRGCPFDCAFCSSKIMWRGRLRWHSIDWIIQFIEKAVKDLRIDGLNFMDDELLCDQKRVSELAKRLIEKRTFASLEVGMPVHGEVLHCGCWPHDQRGWLLSCAIRI